MKPAIVETVMSQLVTEGRDLQKVLIKSEEDAAWNRLIMGRFLEKARKQLPKRGTPTYGWMALLEALEMDDTTASRYIKLAEASLTLTERDKAKIPTYADLGIDRREGAEHPSPTPPRDEDAPPERAIDRDADGAVNVTDDSAVSDTPSSAPSDIEIDRNTWCTPKELAESLGDWDLDPCSNERSHIKAAREFRWERSEDGLFMATSVDANTRVFINPPYARGQVIRWVQAYAHTRFCFLLKFDPSTDWFAELMQHAHAVFWPRGTRIEFEPPPGVPPDKAGANQFPHALFYARAADATKAIREMCFPPWSVK